MSNRQKKFFFEKLLHKNKRGRKINLPETEFFIVDDDESFARSLKRLLNSLGGNAVCFFSAQSFLDSVPCSQRGIAIVDWCMPVHDGAFLMDKMKEINYLMPVIVITGQPLNDTRDLAMRKGAIGFLQKPFNADSLMDIFKSF